MLTLKIDSNLFCSVAGVWVTRNGGTTAVHVSMKAYDDWLQFEMLLTLIVWDDLEYVDRHMRIVDD